MMSIYTCANCGYKSSDIYGCPNCDPESTDAEINTQHTDEIEIKNPGEYHGGVFVLLHACMLTGESSVEIFNKRYLAIRNYFSKKKELRENTELHPDEWDEMVKEAEMIREDEDYNNFFFETWVTGDLLSNGSDSDELIRLTFIKPEDDDSLPEVEKKKFKLGLYSLSIDRELLKKQIDELLNSNIPEESKEGIHNLLGDILDKTEK